MTKPFTNDSDCPCCSPKLTRRDFLKRTTATAATAVAAVSSVRAFANALETLKLPQDTPSESVVKMLYDSLSEKQRSIICFGWNHVDPKRGILRTRVENNWKITEPNTNSDFYTTNQRDMIRAIWEGITDPDWHARFDKQLKDDAGGFGQNQAIAIFGDPDDKNGKFEFVLTGRHMTLRCDGNSAEHVAFGGPIFYGHAAQGFNEKADHPGNVFWPQAQEANKLYQMLDAKHREEALILKGMPDEERVEFKGKSGPFQGIPVTDLARDQKEQLQKVMRMLIEPYRQSDKDEVVACLKSQGGLDACHLAFYAEADIGNDGVWDNWRLEGPTFVWHFRGKPHVHVWVNVADDPSVKLNVPQDSGV